MSGFTIAGSMDSWHGRALRYRPTANDTATAAERVVAVVGPCADLDTDRIRATLKRATANHPRARVALAPDPDSRKWTYQADSLGRAVSEHPEFDPCDLGRLLSEIGNRPGDRLPLEVLICRDYLVVEYSHGIGDGRFGLTLLAALATRHDELLTRSLARSLPPYSVWLALGRHFAAHPSRVRAMLAVRKKNRDALNASGGDEPTRWIDNWRASNRCAVAHLPAQKVAELTEWVAAHAAGSTTPAITIALWLAALRAAGARIDERVAVLVNCRRYLGPKASAGQGNFAVGISMPLPPSPRGITQMVRSVNDSGWPAATLGYAEIVSRWTPPAEVRRPTSIEVPDRLRVVISDVGKLSMFDNVDWAQIGRPPQMAAYLEPDGPDAITLLANELAGGRNLTASFCAAMVDAAVIEDALERLTTDPVGLLEASRP